MDFGTWPWLWLPYQGNYSSWLEQKEARLESEERQEEAHYKALKRETEWVQQNPKARQAKSKARLNAYEELSSKEFQKRNETQELYIPPGPRLGDLVVDVRNISKAYDDRLLYENVSFTVPKGAIVGIVGPTVQVKPSFQHDYGQRKVKWLSAKPCVLPISAKSVTT